jgi:hypothetical protein
VSAATVVTTSSAAGKSSTASVRGLKQDGITPIKP